MKDAELMGTLRRKKKDHGARPAPGRARVHTRVFFSCMFSPRRKE